MYSKEIYYFPARILCITIILILIQYASCQPLSNNAQKVDDSDDNSLWIKPSHAFQLNDMGNENNNDDDDSIANFFVLNSANNEEESSEPVRRANFWKRANFWRKRANFW